MQYAGELQPMLPLRYVTEASGRQAYEDPIKETAIIYLNGQTGYVEAAGIHNAPGGALIGVLQSGHFYVSADYFAILFGYRNSASGMIADKVGSVTLSLP